MPISEENHKLTLTKSIITWVIRILTGAVFIFSGLAKCIDIWGTVFKIEDYFNVLHFPLSDYLSAFISFILSMSEFILGVLLLFGCFRRSIPILIALFMVVMLPLTLWIAIFNPVPDCGCFGDALLISNWATFFKNVVLTAFAVWLIIFNRKIKWIIMPSIQWLFFVVSIIFIFIISFIGYADQPIIDFRDYKIGKKIITDSELDVEEPQFVFVYEKDGIKKEFHIDEDMPDEEDGWQFIERKEIESKSEKNHAGESLSLFDIYDNSEIPLSSVISSDKSALILLFPSLKDISLASSYKINAIKEWADHNDVEIIALTGSPKEDVETWKDESMSKYPIFGLDDTTIKIIARGNPALVYVENGVIKWKHTLRIIPLEEFMNESKKLNLNKLEDLKPISLITLTMLYFSVIGFLILLSFIPSLRNCFRFKKKSSRSSIDDDRVHF